MMSESTLPPDAHKLTVSGRRIFTNEFMAKAVERVIKGGEKVGAVAADIQVVHSVLHRWVERAKVGKVMSKSVAVSKSLNGKHPPPKSKARERRKYTPEFMEKAVKRLYQGEAIGELAKELDVPHSVLSRWRDGKLKRLKLKVPKRSAKLHSYPAAFRQKAVARVFAGEQIRDIAASMKVHSGSIYTWVRTAQEKGEGPKMLEGVPKGAASVVSGHPVGTRDAISFLKHAKADMHDMLQRGDIKEFDSAHLLALLALNALLGRDK